MAFELFRDSATGFAKPDVVREFLKTYHERDMERHEAALRAELQKTESELQRAKFAADLREKDLQHQQFISTLQLETTSDKVRSFVLILVVLAVVLTPLLAMGMGTHPDSFIKYITPITGITGTVLGYWFGRHESKLRAPRTTFEVNAEEKIVGRVA